MDYAEDTKTETAMINAIGAKKEILKSPKPSCMREHIDILQTDIARMQEMAAIQDKRIQKLENLVGI